MRRFLSLWVIMLFCWAAPAIAKDDSVQTSWRLLDYIAVDYPGAVSASGKVLSDPEYARLTGQRGYERMATHFSMKQSIDKTMAVYAEVLRLPPPQPSTSQVTA